MVQRPHRIERVRRVPRSGCNSRPRCRKISIGVPNADAHTAFVRLRYEFSGACELRCHGHDPNMSASCLPELLECCNGWLQQVLRKMHAPAYVAEERSLQTYAQCL